MGSNTSTQTVEVSERTAESQEQVATPEPSPNNLKKPKFSITLITAVPV
jgi:hypothetical protein